ncbi:MAG: HD domain-containing protein [archaeon]
MQFLNFLSEIGRLKEIKRSGWVKRNIKEAESVSDHSFRTALLAMLYSKALGLNAEKCIKMALIHDIHEVYTGDIILTRANEKQKLKKELRAIKDLSKLLPKEEGKEILKLWEELHAARTNEAKLVRDLDKIEMLLQALEYKKSNRTKNSLQEFFDSTEKMLKTKKAKELFTGIKKEFDKI